MVTLPLPSLRYVQATRVPGGLGAFGQPPPHGRWAVQVMVTTDGPSKVLRFRLKNLGAGDDDDDVDDDDVGFEGWSVDEGRRRRSAMAVQPGPASPRSDPGPQQQQAMAAALTTSQPGRGPASSSSPSASSLLGAVKAVVSLPSVVVSVVDDSPEEVLVLGLDDVALEADSNAHLPHRHEHLEPGQGAEGRRGWRVQVSRRPATHKRETTQRVERLN